MELNKNNNVKTEEPINTDDFFEKWRFKTEDAEPDQMRFELIDETPKDVMVSVAMLAYDHEEFIRQALDSILMQKIDFSLKVVIADDCSTDKTREILLEYQKKYPDIFKLVFQKKNLRHIQNNLDLYRNLEGKYVAVLEGDDYWTDPNKLQKQIDFLEANPNYSFCCHNNSISVFETGEISLRNDKDYPESDIDLKAILIKRIFASGTLVYRTSALTQVTIYMISRLFNFDYALVVLLAEQGAGRYFPDNMAVYRKHEGGVWTGIKDAEQFHKIDEKFFKLMLTHFHDPEIREVINYKLKENDRNLARGLIRSGQLLKGTFGLIRNSDFPQKSEFANYTYPVWWDYRAGIKKVLKFQVER